MIGRLAAAASLAAAIVLGSCSENGLLSPLTERASQVSIDTISAGTMVASGDQIPLTLKYNQSQVSPSDLKIELLNSQGVVVQTADVKNVDFSAPLPPLQLPALDSGTYSLRFTLYDANNQVALQKSVDFFYTTQGSYDLEGIVSYPPTLAPGANGLLLARLSVPDGTNPYLRWSMGSKVIAEGYLHDGLDKIQWTAPSTTGVYSVMVELFPFGPTSTADFSFTSPYSMHVEIFVTDSTKSAGRNELGPAADYNVLFHFRGDLTDSSAHAWNASPIGNPALGVNGSVFGFQLDGSSGFKIPAFVLPASKGALQPFSVTMRIRLDAYQFNRTFFSATTSDGATSFVIATNQDGKLAATLDSVTESGSIALPTGNVTTVTLSVIPSSDGVSLMWFTDGALALVDSIAASTAVAASSGESVIAGTNGFTGLVDEFGVFYRDDQSRPAVDPTVFRRAMSEEYGASLIFAEGFDGIYLPGDLQYDSATTDASVGGGSLTLAPASNVTLPPIAIGNDESSLQIAFSQFPQGASGTVVIASGGQTLFTYTLDATLNATAPLKFVFTRNGSGPTVSVGSQTQPLPQDFGNLEVTVTNTGKQPFAVRSFLVVKDRVRISSTTADSTES